MIIKKSAKDGLLALLSEIMEPSEENLCFLVFKRYIELILDEGKGFDEAVDFAMQTDLSHTYVKGHCQTAFDKFQANWNHYQVKDSKVRK